MKNRLSNDYLVIDTNVFEHLLNNSQNTDNHIGKLLGSLTKEDIGLAVDDRGRIAAEYQHRFAKHKQTPNQDHLYIWKYWAQPERIKFRVKVDHSTELMRSIKNIVRATQKSTVDRIFIYVAIFSNRVLITNDKQDIIVGDEATAGDRRSRLLAIAHRHGKENAKIYTSLEAYQRMRPKFDSENYEHCSDNPKRERN